MTWMKQLALRHILPNYVILPCKRAVPQLLLPSPIPVSLLSAYFSLWHVMLKELKNKKHALVIPVCIYNRLFTCISIAPQECSVPVLYSFEKLVIGQASPMPNICFELCSKNLLNIRLTCTEMKHKTFHNFIRIYICE